LSDCTIGIDLSRRRLLAMKRKQLSLRQVLVLLLVGVVVGYPSWIAFEASQWGDVPQLVALGLLIAVVSLLAGTIGLLVIAVRAFASMLMPPR
jgi:hypothetical protein